MRANQVGRYILEYRLGQGGMAEVWKAHHESLGHPVALKFLISGLAENRRMQTRFLEEGRKQCALDHPNIVRVLDFFSEDQRSYLVLQYVEGRSLEECIGRPLTAPSEFSWAMQLGLEMFDALHYAHLAGIVHRDVKPGNVLIDRGGASYLMDFGISLTLAGASARETRDVGAGTPEYMSPEQIERPWEIDGRSDLYSLGVMLYELVCGRVPFHSPAADGGFMVKTMHLSAAPPPPRSLNPAVPAGLERFILRCLEKRPENRFQTAAHGAEVLRQVAANPVDENIGERKVVVTTPVPEEPLDPPRRRAPWVWVLLAASILLAASVLWNSPSRTKLDPVVPKQPLALKPAPIVPNPRPGTMPAVAPKRAPDLSPPRADEPAPLSPAVAPTVPASAPTGEPVPPPTAGTATIPTPPTQPPVVPPQPKPTMPAPPEQQPPSPAALVQTGPAVPSPPPPRPPAYSGPRTGTVIWSGALTKGQEVVIDGTTATSGALQSAGLPGVPVMLTVDTPQIGLSRSPGPSTGNTRFAFRSHTQQKMVVVFRWTVL